MIEVIGFSEAAVLYKGCDKETDWDSKLNELFQKIIEEGGYTAELNLVKAELVTEFFLRDFHLILAVRNKEENKGRQRFCYVLEFDLLSNLTLSMLTGLIATSVVSLIVSHYFDNRDTGYLSSYGVRTANEMFPEAVIET